MPDDNDRPQPPPSASDSQQQPCDESKPFVLSSPDGPWVWLKRNARLWGAMAFVVFMLWAFRSVILPFVLAMLVAYIIAPLLNYLGRARVAGRPVPRFVWIIVVYVVLLGILGLFITSFVPRLSNDVKRLLAETPAFWQKAREVWVPTVATWVQKNFSPELPSNGASDQAQKAVKTGPVAKIKTTKDGELVVDLSHFQFEAHPSTDGHWTIRPPPPEDTLPHGPERFRDTINHYASDLVRRSESAINQIFRLGQKFVLGIFKTITTFILVLMVSAFLLADTDKILVWMRNLAPIRYRQDVDNVVVLIDKGLSGAIRGQFIICIINGVLTWAGLHLIGIKYPLLLGLLAGIFSLIPIFGSIISSIPIAIVALVSGESGVEILRGFLILLWIIGIHLLEANLLNPKIMGTAAKIHPVLVIFAVVAGERTYGAVGALLGVPIFSAMQATFLYLRARVPRPDGDPLSTSDDNDDEVMSSTKPGA